MVITTLKISFTVSSRAENESFGKWIIPCFQVMTSLLDAAQASGYKLEKLLELVK